METMSTNVMSNSWLSYDKRPIWQYVGSWILLVPLLFFATKGGFLHPNDPSHLGEYTTDISSAEAARDRLEQIAIWVICLAFRSAVLRNKRWLSSPKRSISSGRIYY